MFTTHLLTGYIGSVGFLEGVVGVYNALRQRNPGIKYVCDPVLGDNGKLYVSDELVECYRTKVVPLATVLTPNQFEVELLTGIRIRRREDAARACDTFHKHGVCTVVVTSIEYEAGDDDEMSVFASHLSAGKVEPLRREMSFAKLPFYFTGTGDLTAAVFLAWMHRSGDNIDDALSKTIHTVQAVLARTMKEGKPVGGARAPELRLIQSKRDIECPEAARVPNFLATARSWTSSS